MGQTLSSPATQKFSESGGDERFLFSVSEMQGWRISMEDAHAIVLDLDNNGQQKNTFFAVYDGHGGGTVAKYAGQHVHKRLVTEESYHVKLYDVALKRAFLGTDEDLLADPAHSRDPSGCTAVAALVTHDNKIYVANAGDSRSVISVKGQVKPLSFDHKPSNESEKARITGAGGYVEYGRVNGNLALSRALGDFGFKKNYAMTAEKQVITADPDIIVHDISDEDEFLILACDGIWDCLSSQQVVDFVRLKVSEGKELAEIGELMCDHLLAPDTSSGAGIGCDNMTVLIVALLHGRTKEEWYAWVTDRVNSGYGYDTPKELPQIYAQSRLMTFRARREAQDKARQEHEESGSSGFLGGSGSPFGGLARVLGSTGGISFHPGSAIMSDTGALMFGNDDSDDDDDSGDDDYDNSRSFFSETLGLGRSGSPDATQHPKAQIEDIEDEDIHKDYGHLAVEDAAGGVAPTGDAHMADGDSHEEAPPPPKTLPNGDGKKVERLKSLPGGDEPSPAVKAEGLMDKSEDPMKV